MITLSDVTKTYSSDVQIGPVNLPIPPGGVTTRGGPNGAGKSTLLTMIGRLLGIDAGVIEIAGLDVAATKSNDLAKVVSILRQENSFITRLTVRQLVGFGRFPHSKGRLTAADEEAISQAIDFLDMTELEGRYLDQLSGGQRQRANVAMVLAQDTEYVLLDEPLNNLDMKHSVQMMQHLRRGGGGRRPLAGGALHRGRTIVVVLHDINFAANYSDLICAVKDGAIVEFGPPSYIMDPARLSAIFGTPVNVFQCPSGPFAVYF
ncbi:MAG: ATP-binding cassette domain-containing protein [Ruaniaceae bacterium]|nr:ATP-binding cassette domain-containing protein [Ruaniaceae bacterium]